MMMAGRFASTLEVLVFGGGRITSPNHGSFGTNSCQCKPV